MSRQLSMELKSFSSYFISMLEISGAKARATFCFSVVTESITLYLLEISRFGFCAMRFKALVKSLIWPRTGVPGLCSSSCSLGFEIGAKG